MARGYRGGTAKLYQEATWDDGEDIPGSPSWTNIARAIDVSAAITRAEASVPSRESDWNKIVPGLIDGKITAGYRLRQLADAVWDGLLAELLAATPILIAMMTTNIATSGSKGWRVPAVVLDASPSQPLNDGASGNLVFGPADSEDASGAVLDPARLVTA